MSKSSCPKNKKSPINSWLQRIKCLKVLVLIKYKVSKSSCPKNQNALNSSYKEGWFVAVSKSSCPICLKVLVHIQQQTGVDVSKPSSTPNNFSLHNINYRKLCISKKYTINNETKSLVHGHQILNFTSLSKKFRLWCLFFILHGIHSNASTIKK